jgi:hypothetical protein
LVSDIPAGDGNVAYPFLPCSCSTYCTFVKTVCFTGDTMRFGIHNLLREKVEEFSDDEENIEVEETDIEDHEEEEEEEDEEGMEEEKRGKAHIAPELSETKKNFKQEEVRNNTLKDDSVRCFLSIPSFPISSILLTKEICQSRPIF